MRTWRNLGDRAKLASFLEIQLATNLATILASLATMLASSEPLLGSSRKQISPLVSRSMIRVDIFLEVSVAPMERMLAGAAMSLD
ncbi:hypothetical protein TNCV_2446501 [Trichonephila clavipes]|nr:hypothetical protein TNCV_2446501 [Trichonephila clavipes]